MMIGIIFVVLMLMALVGVCLALVSEGFAHEVSRATEAAFDAVEYRLVLRERNRAARERGVREAREAPYAAGAGLIW